MPRSVGGAIQSSLIIGVIGRAGFDPSGSAKHSIVDRQAGRNL
jgi:hypothetical protein